VCVSRFVVCLLMDLGVFLLLSSSDNAAIIPHLLNYLNFLKCAYINTTFLNAVYIENLLFPLQKLMQYFQ
jgi:hypothetical protein